MAVAAESGEFVPVTAHLQDCASEPKPVAEDLILGNDRAAGQGVVARDHRAPFADRAGGMSVADNTIVDFFSRDRGVSSPEALLGKNGPAGLAVSDRSEREVGAWRALLADKDRAGGLSVPDNTNADDVFARETNANILKKKFFAEHYFARKTGAPPIAGIAAADEHLVAGEAVRAAPSFPHAEQVTIDVLVVDDKAAGVPIAAKATDAGGHGGNLSTVLGIVVASSAVTTLAAGAVTPPVAFATFLLLLGGLFVAVSGVLKN